MNIANQIIQAAFDLFMKYGVRSVSMDDLANQLGMSKKTIYGAFESKETLIQKVINRHLQSDQKNIQHITANANDAIEEMFAISQHVLQSIMQIKPSLIFDLKKFYPMCWELIEKEHFAFIKNTIEQNIVRGQAEGLYRQEINADIIAKLYVGKSNSIVNPEIFPITEYDLAALIKEMWTYHLNGIVSEAGKAKLKSIPFYSL
jgi:AcrR family transcriptional regulator